MLEQKTINILFDTFIKVNNDPGRKKIMLFNNVFGGHFTIHQMSGCIDVHRFDANFKSPYDSLFKIRIRDLVLLSNEVSIYLPYLFIKHLLTRTISYSELIKKNWHIIPTDEESPLSKNLVIQKRKELRLSKKLLELTKDELIYACSDFQKLNSKQFTLLSESGKFLGILIKHSYFKEDVIFINKTSLKSFCNELFSIVTEIIKQNNIKNKAELSKILKSISKVFN